MKYTEYINSPIFWLRRVHLATRKAIDAEFEAFGLTGPQYEILCQLWLQDGLEQRMLQERLRITSATLTGIVDGLAERRLVERRVSHEDARVKQLFLTEHGRTLEQQLGDAVMRVQTRLLNEFSPSETALFQDWLRRMAHNLFDVPDECA